jgi:hypothetical protein
MARRQKEEALPWRLDTSSGMPLFLTGFGALQHVGYLTRCTCGALTCLRYGLDHPLCCRCARAQFRGDLS